MRFTVVKSGKAFWSCFAWAGSDDKPQIIMALTRALSKTAVLPLNNGRTIPVFGLGVYLAKSNGETEQACLWALENGYRMIDTAAIYRYRILVQLV